MTIEELRSILTGEKADEEFLQFCRVAKKRSQRSDLHALLLLDALLPSNKCIICAVEHEKIHLSVGLEELALVITEEQAIELRRCGVSYSDETDSLFMFV